MSRREVIEAALRAWRGAERQQAQAVDGERESATREVTIHRAEYQRLSAEHMVGAIGRLQEAEDRRAHAVPSTPPFHEAARDTEEIAAEIWEAARRSDEDTPQTEANQRTAPKGSAPRSPVPEAPLTHV